MDQPDYLTLAAPASDEVTIQKSRFIGHASPCSSEEEALAFLRSIRDQYRAARHVCFGYMVGINEGIMCYSDDGEPGGTAGLPIMNVLRGAHLVNCVCGVVRYFGGILLGTGGLVRAYTEGCKIAVSAAGIIRMERTCRLLCDVPYPAWDSLQHAARQLPDSISDIRFEIAVDFTLLVRSRDLDDVVEELQRATNRRLTWIPDGEEYAPWPASQVL